MCDPMTLAVGSFAVAGAQTIASHQAAQKKAAALNNQRKAVYNENLRRAQESREQEMENYRQTTSGINRRIAEERIAAAQQRRQVQLEGQADESARVATLAATGVRGNVADLFLGEAARSRDERIEAINLNAGSAIRQLNLRRENTEPTLVRDPIKPGKVEGPGVASLAGNLAGDAMGAAQTYRSAGGSFGGGSGGSGGSSGSTPATRYNMGRTYASNGGGKFDFTGGTRSLRIG